MAPRLDASTAVAPVALAGSCDRSREPDDHEGRRTLGLCPEWHMDVPRPFVKTGRRPEGWDIGPGCGGPVRADASTGHGGPVRSRRIYRSRRPLRSRRFTRGKRPHRESSIGESTLQPGTTTGPARRLRLEPPTSAGFRNGNKKSPACAGLRVWRGGGNTPEGCRGQGERSAPGEVMRLSRSGSAGGGVGGVAPTYGVVRRWGVAASGAWPRPTS